MRTLYDVLKDHKNPIIQDLINSSSEGMEILVSDGDLLD